MKQLSNVSNIIDNSVSPPTIIFSNEVVTQIKTDNQEKVYETRYIYVNCDCKQKNNKRINKCNNCCNSINYKCCNFNNNDNSFKNNRFRCNIFNSIFHRNCN